MSRRYEFSRPVCLPAEAWSQGRLSDLDRQCKLLLSTAREYSQRLVEADASAIVSEADEIERCGRIYLSLTISNRCLSIIAEL